MNAYRLIAETNGLRFQIEIIEDMSVRLPENQLKKALSNILSNAVNYTEAERHIKVKLEKSVLSIQNECVPLSPDELQHIEKLSEYIASTGKRYQSHAATIRRWAGEDAKKTITPSRNRDYSVKEDETV